LNVEWMVIICVDVDLDAFLDGDKYRVNAISRFGVNLSEMIFFRIVLCLFNVFFEVLMGVLL